jgi:helix-turn-helix protein
MEQDLVEMSRRERDVLKVMSLVLKGERTQIEAARLLNRSVRQIRRIQRRLEKEKDAGVVHRLRGRPSNRRVEAARRRRALGVYRQKLMGFGPTLAAENLEEMDCAVHPRTLHLWLVAEGLWSRQRRVKGHRRRRERRECFGEMVQADASAHDWLEGRGPMLTLVGLIDDATGRITTRFYPSETTEAYMDLLGRHIRRFGRPVSWYSDRHGIFRAEESVEGYDEKQSVPTQFSRALKELDIELILANSPQAKGRVERLWGTCQDRWVKELRLAKVKTMEQANQWLESKLEPAFNRKFTVKSASGNDAHRALDRSQDLASILSIQEKRTVANDYTIRFENRTYQLLPPMWPGERKGVVIVERRLDGSLHVRLKRRYLAYKELSEVERMSLALEPIPVMEVKDPAVEAAGSITAHRAGRRSGRTPALPYPPASGSCGRGKDAYRPVPSHPWRTGGQHRTLLLAPKGGHF